MICVTNSTATVQNPDRRKLPGESYGERWLRLYADDVKIYARCELAELEDVYDALKDAADAASSVYNRPRVDCDSPAGSFINDIQEKLDERRAALIEHVKRRPVTTAEDWDVYSRILMTYETDCGADLKQMAILVEQLQAMNPALVGRA